LLFTRSKTSFRKKKKKKKGGREEGGREGKEMVT